MVINLDAVNKVDVVASLFEKLRNESFFGIVEFHCMDGHVVRIKKIESFEPKEFDRLVAE